MTVVLGIVTDTLDELPAAFPALVSLRAAAVPRRMVGHRWPGCLSMSIVFGRPGRFLPEGRPRPAGADRSTYLVRLAVGLACLSGHSDYHADRDDWIHLLRPCRASSPCLMLSQTIYLVVDRNFGAITALETSHSLTDGHKWDLFLLFVLVVLLGFLACLPCLLGLLFYFPWVGVLGAVTYLRLSGQPVGEP